MWPPHSTALCPPDPMTPGNPSPAPEPEPCSKGFTGRVLKVAVAGPVPGLFDYLPPESCATERAGDPVFEPGQRLLVPFGRARRVGILVALAESSDHPRDRLRAVCSVLDPGPLIPRDILDLVGWVADYYHHPIGDALFAALPARLRRPSPPLDDLADGARATPVGRATDPASLGRARSQRRLLALLQGAPAGVTLDALRDGQGDCQGPLRELVRKGLVERCRLPDPARDGAAPAGAAVPLAGRAPGPELNPDQARAVRAVVDALGGFRSFLLEGVTGSGKTEVYIRLIEAVIARGGQALVLVPEIALTPQLQERLQRRLPGPHALLHSALDDASRERAWHRAARGEATLALGTRSACLVPLPRLALILVDEEHDASLKQQEGLRYSARDLAVRRAQMAGCPVVLGSATPSLETLHNANLGRYQWLGMPERAGGAREPALALIDIRGQPLSAGLGPLLREHVAAHVASGEQVLLFLNRRGFAPLQTCHACGWVGACPDCDARLTLHLRLRRLWCHHCGWYRPAPSRCPECGSEDLRTLGLGTERLEDELRGLFPDVPLARVDRDSTRRKGELDRILGAVRRGEVRILLGTQMLAKGHDFPGVTLVGILDLDQSLYAADFRAPERTAQLIVQVAGRAGRAERPGRVVLQTRHPEHPLLQSLLHRGYPGFAELALAEREAAGLPPFAFLALLRADSVDPESPSAFLRRARDAALAAGAQAAGVRLLGPVPAPMERRAGRYRAQLLLECPRRADLQRFLAPWVARLREPAVAGTRSGGLRWSLDVDPQDML